MITVEWILTLHEQKKKEKKSFLYLLNSYFSQEKKMLQGNWIIDHFSWTKRSEWIFHEYAICIWGLRLSVSCTYMKGSRIKRKRVHEMFRYRNQIFELRKRKPNTLTQEYMFLRWWLPIFPDIKCVVDFQVALVIIINELQSHNQNGLKMKHKFESTL